MCQGSLFERYQELQSYVGWTTADALRLAAAAPGIHSRLSLLIDDFYAEIERHPAASRVITGGQTQIDRLKGTLLRWVEELLSGRYDQAYVERRRRVGRRHVEIGLEQAYTTAALARLHTGLVRAIQETWQGEPPELRATVEALSKLISLDLAIIEDAYQAEYTARLRRAEEERLAVVTERSEATFHNLVETAECMVIILRVDHTIAYFSPYAERLSGYSAAEALGRDYLELLLPEGNRRAVADEFARVIAGCPTQGYELPVVCRDCSFLWVTWNARYLADFQGSSALLIVGQDITYLKQAQERALRAERLAAIGQMVAGLAHESRNALQRGQACLEMLALTVRDRPESLGLVARVQQAQDHLHHLYEDVRGYAAPITLERRVCDLRQVWREAWAQLEPAWMARSGAKLCERVDGVDLHCLADPFRLGQVFRNLLDNALVAAPEPVTIEIRAANIDLLRRPFLRISVSDNGPGVPREQRDKIFEPFFSTKTRGTGLGLAIARRIIDAHGGVITLADDGPPGALFHISLPRGTP